MEVSLENWFLDIGALSVKKNLLYISSRTREGKEGRREIRVKQKTKQNKKHTQKEQVKNS